MKVRVKKLYNGNISLRSNIVEEAIKNREIVTVMFGNECMCLTPTLLKEGTSDNRIYRSRFGDLTYKLIDF